ncbi:MAG: T9SS type A sorting domain-containing protein [bacterium]|nr:T9SS type A sorting domain-containing protein [bacterium]
MSTPMKLVAILTLLLALSGLVPVSAQDSLGVSMMGRFHFSQATSIVVSGNYLYLAEVSNGVTIFDISNPSTPAPVGSIYNEGSAADLVIVDTTLFVLGIDRICTYDIRNPPAVTQLYMLSLPTDNLNFTIVDHYIYVVTVSRRLIVIEAFHPGDLVELSRLQLSHSVSDVALFNRHAYLPGYNGTVIVNVADPAAPVLVGLDTTLGDWTTAISIVGNTGLVKSETEGLLGVWFQSPTLLRRICTFPNSIGCTAFAWNDSLAFLAFLHGSLQIYDIRNLAVPRLLTTFGQLDFPECVYLQGNRAFVSDYHFGFQVLNIATPSSPTTIGSYSQPGFIQRVAIASPFAYTACGGYGLKVFDYRNPFAPRLAGTYDTPGSVIGVAVQNQYAYLADSTGGLRIVEVTDPANPVQTGVLTYLETIFDVAVRGQYAFILGSLHGLKVVDVSLPATPVEVSHFDSLLSVPRRLVLDSNYAYIATSSNSVVVIDIRDPLQLRFVASIHVPLGVYGIAVSGTTLFLTSNTELKSYDVSDPALPVQVGQYQTLIGNGQIWASGDYVFCSVYTTDLLVIDASNPSNLQLAGLYNCRFLAPDGSIVTNGDTLFVGARESFGIFNIHEAVRVIERPPNETTPTDFRIEQLYPNPFNASTTLIYTLPKSANVRLELFDITGRTVGTVFDWSQDAGTYSVKINSDNLSSGTYFAFLSAGKQSLSRKFVVLK